MATIELVEQLRRSANVSYQDAKEALDMCDDDVLEALIYLEKIGKVKPPNQGGSFSTQRTTSYTPPKSPPTPESDKENLHSVLSRFFNWIIKWIKRGNANYFVVHREKEYMFSLPITILILLFIITFWTCGFVLLLGLFFGFRYSFQGPNIHTPYSPNDPKQNKTDGTEEKHHE